MCECVCSTIGKRMQFSKLSLVKQESRRRRRRRRKRKKRKEEKVKSTGERGSKIDLGPVAMMLT